MILNGYFQVAIFDIEMTLYDNLVEDSFIFYETE
jgi:hypothetical protein